MSVASEWLETARTLGREFATRSASCDAEDKFVAENYAALKEKSFFSLGVPAELGGAGATHAELCAIIRELARHCSSTGLAASMHTHLVATLAYLWRAGNKGPEPMLRRVVSDGLVLVSTGGSDWLPGSGKLEKVDGGYRMTGRKIFGSGVPAGDVLMTTGIFEDPTDGPTVFHFPVPLKSEGVKVLDTWRVLGMRATGSHDIQLDSVFIPEAHMAGVRRPAGKWHPFMHTACLVALPVIYSAYLGVVEAARQVALDMAKRKKDDRHTAEILGEMENQVVTAQIAQASMLDLAASAKPGPETTAAVLCRRTIFVNACLRAMEKAMEAAGGASFFRSAPLERLFRDVQGVRFHPVQEKPQTRYVGRLLLGLDVDG